MRWIAAGLVLAALLVAIGVAARDLWAPGPGPSGSVEMTIARGTPIRDIAHALEAQRIVRSARAFTLLARLSGQDRGIQAGNYMLPRRRTPGSILRILVRGDVARSLVTIPEGLRIEQVAAIFAREARIDSSAFVRGSCDPRLSDSLGVGHSGLEGYLFPETYSVLLGSSPREIAVRMVRLALREEEALAARRTQAAPASTAPVPMTRNEIMTLASIIQSEAQVAGEMPRISAVFQNRLRLGWRLEADPTVQYALGTHKPRILYEDLEVDSPYNTYRHEGLPPGPICSPGRDAISAALWPALGEQSLYFVARGDGTHVFTQTLDEHLRARAAARRGP